ncbi:MAG: hypothetical protein WCT07_02075 [Candidatus Paceibacterota bacterium]
MKFKHFEHISTGSVQSPYGFKKFSSLVLSSISLSNLDLEAVLVTTRMTKSGYEWYIYPIELVVRLFTRGYREKHVISRRKNKFHFFISIVEPTGMMSQVLLKPEPYLSLLAKNKKR